METAPPALGPRDGQAIATRTRQLVRSSSWSRLRLDLRSRSMPADPVGLTASREDIAMTSEPRRRTPAEVRSILDQLQLLADRPQLRHRLGLARVSTRAPFADSRRPNDAARGYRFDNRSRRSDQERNYAAGLL